MFRRVVLDNFKSFGHVEFDLSGPRGKPHGHAVILGENGSGKTNLVQAFQFLLDSAMTLSYAKVPAKRGVNAILPAHCVEDKELNEALWSASILVNEIGIRMEMSKSVGVLVRAFRARGTDEPMKAEYTFTVNGADATYSMEFGSPDRIVSERLRCRVNGRTSDLFAITRGEDGRVSARFHGSFFDDAARASEVKRRTADRWGDHTALSILRTELGNGGLCGEIADVLHSLDDVRVLIRGRVGPYIDLESGSLPKSDRASLMGYQEAISDFFDRMYPEIVGAHYLIDEGFGRLGYTLMFEKRMGDRTIDVPASSESRGVRSLLTLLPYLMDYARGKTVIIDGFGDGIHSVVAEDLLKEMLERDEGQLILTTHDTSLLRDLDPRNAYVIRYVPDGKKEIVPFSSLAKTRKRDDNEARYRRGVFDGVTFISCVNLDGIVESYDVVAGEGGSTDVQTGCA